MSVTVDVLLSGELSMPHAYTFRPAGGPAKRLVALVRPSEPPLRAPCLAFVVRHPSAGTILVDTGLHPDAHASVAGDFGRPMGLMFASLRPAGAPFDEQLRGAGVEPATVERVVMTHLHVDHTSGMRLLPNATFTCTTPEWTAATARGAVRGGYVSSHLPAAGRMDLLDLAGDGEPLGPFAHSLDLLGDGSIRLLSTPGHTRGHLSVLLETRTGTVLLAGDAAYTLRSIREQALPLLVADRRAAADTLRRLQAFARERPDAVIVPSHDPEAWRALRTPREAVAEA